MKLTGNTILITGGTSGIGRALAEAFYARGNRVIVAGRRQHLLDEVTRDRPGLESLHVDLDVPASVDRLARDVRARFPDLNVLIANAGISAPRRFVWNETFTMSAGSRARWGCGQVAGRPVHMSTGRS